jgi:hypothetical protein
MMNAATRLEKARAIAARLSTLPEDRRRDARIAFLRHDQVLQDLHYFMEQADRTGSPIAPAALQVLLPAYEESRRGLLTAMGEDPASDDFIPSLRRRRACDA